HAAADQETKGLKDKKTEATELGNFERDHFDILKRAPNGAVPCSTREELVACLLRLQQDGELRMQLAKRAVAAGQRDFDPSMIRERFWEVLKEVAS
ncbi:MAG: glycosyltransferase, partial [Chthoniobacterales bacterium]